MKRIKSMSTWTLCNQIKNLIWIIVFFHPGLDLGFHWIQQRLVEDEKSNWPTSSSLLAVELLEWLFKCPHSYFGTLLLKIMPLWINVNNSNISSLFLVTVWCQSSETNSTRPTTWFCRRWSDTHTSLKTHFNVTMLKSPMLIVCRENLKNTSSNFKLHPN